MRSKKRETTTRSGALFRARLDQIINLKHEQAQLAKKVDGQVWKLLDNLVWAGPLKACD